jgi:hypothetical protein
VFLKVNRMDQFFLSCEISSDVQGVKFLPSVLFAD